MKWSNRIARALALGTADPGDLPESGDRVRAGGSKLDGIEGGRVWTPGHVGKKDVPLSAASFPPSSHGPGTTADRQGDSGVRTTQG
jgi:hypothetical protein